MPSIVPPSVGSVPYYYPEAASREAMTIPFTTGSMNASLEEVKAVYYRNGFLGDKAVYALAPTDYAVNGQLLELSEPFMQSIPESFHQMELRLSFSSGHIVPVTLKPKEPIQLNKQAFDQYFHERYAPNQTIVLPFYTAIAENPNAPKSLKEGIYIVTNGVPTELGPNDTIAFGGMNNKELHIQLDQPLATNSQTFVVVEEQMLIDPTTGMVQEMGIDVFLPALRFAVGPETVYYDTGQPMAKQVKLFPYDIPAGDLTIMANSYDSSGVWLGFTIGLQEGIDYTLQSVNGQRQLTLLPAYMNAIPANAASTELELDLEDVQAGIQQFATLYVKPLPLPYEWIITQFMDVDQLEVWLQDDVLVQGVDKEHNDLLPRLSEQIQLTRDGRIVQPLYMLGDVEYFHPSVMISLDNDARLEGTANQLFFLPSTWMMSSGLVLNNGTWSSLFDATTNPNDPAEFLYTLVDLPVQVMLGPSEIISSIRMDADSLTTQDYTLGTNADGIQTVILKQSYLQNLFSAAVGSDSRPFTIVISELNGGQLEVKEEVTIQVLYRNM